MLQVKTEKISEKVYLMAVVDKADLVLVAGTFEDADTSEQVAAILSMLLKKTGLIETEEEFPSPDVSFKELCASWTGGKYTSQLIKFAH